VIMPPRIPRRGIAIHQRRGITLMEVLIAIGILAVGLTSVVSLVPAGQSQAARALILDRGASMVANGLQDAVTYGLTRPDSVAFDPNGSNAVWVFDPVVQKAGGATGDIFPNAAGAMLKTAGIYSQASTVAGSWQVLQLLGQGRDDILVSPGTDADDPPVNRYDANGIRLFNGRMSCLFSVARADNQSKVSPEAGDVAKLTVVAFHNRNLSPASLSETLTTATYNPLQQTLTGVTVPAGRTLKEVVRPGVVIYDGSKVSETNQYLRWSQVLMASINDSVSPPEVYVTFSSPPPTGTNVSILLDSVGMAEQMVVLEGSGPYSK